MGVANAAFVVLLTLPAIVASLGIVQRSSDGWLPTASSRPGLWISTSEVRPGR